MKTHKFLFKTTTGQLYACVIEYTEEEAKHIRPSQVFLDKFGFSMPQCHIKIW